MHIKLARPRQLLRASLAAAVLVSCVLTVQTIEDPAAHGESFPGFLGAAAKAEPGAVSRVSGIDSSKIIQLSAWQPRAYLYKGFLSESECDHIVNKANPRLERSGVTNNNDGHTEISEIRTSSGMFIDKGEDDVIKAIEERVSEWTFLPIPNQEPLQVLRYTKGQKYEPHVDYFHDPVNTQRGGHRYATVLMYLNTPELGGETVFPTAKDDTPKDDTWSDCAKGFLAVKPQKGDALLFFSMHPDGTPDETSLHYACPVVRGEKWSAPMWIHVADFSEVYRHDSKTAAAMAAGGESEAAVEMSDTADDGSGCLDTNGLCKYWASQGECEKNSAYMLSACRKSCKAC